LRLKRIFPS